VDDEEFDPGVRCVAAAIRDHRGKVAASVGISSPSVRVTLGRIPELGEIVVETARQMGPRVIMPPAFWTSEDSRSVPIWPR